MPILLVCPCLLALLTAAWDQSSFWLGLKQAIMFDMPPLLHSHPPNHATICHASSLSGNPPSAEKSTMAAIVVP